MPHTIKVIRQWATDNSTISRLIIADARPGSGEIAQGYILERPGPDTTQSGLRLRIPEGRYQLQWQTRTNLPGVRPHLPVPWLSNGQVPSSRYIYIHNGNYPRNTDGCLLIGRSRDIDMVGSSVDALNRLKTYLQRVGIDKVIVEITSAYE
ncbi:DUF5675 family protein [Alkalimonas sp. MEB108]|uniref:DUF5675 family protein n=1 Tax=Alkalimonas cellulosilytica TaxID=3058395 RepID=A0ABU7J6V0_9GAMM|nr:DUF5675 family protein [Alkalimonas sp. MEB108]MEE2001995.1 DUF5675 family protein [Alkalimonas sp. MEB108]